MNTEQKVDRYIKTKKLKSRLGLSGGLLLILAFSCVPLAVGNPKISASFFEVMAASGLFKAFILPLGMVGVILLVIAFKIEVSE